MPYAVVNNSQGGNRLFLSRISTGDVERRERLHRMGQLVLSCRGRGRVAGRGAWETPAAGVNPERGCGDFGWELAGMEGVGGKTA